MSNHCTERMSTEGTDQGLPYRVVARQLGHRRIVLETLQVCGHPVPLPAAPTFGSLQTALEIGTRLAEQYIGQLIVKQAGGRPGLAAGPAPL
ncbi:hypothetical protein XB05_05645 [Xanthomonas arboricola]|nr:hypothetical protein [Xanthomonas arboricola]AKC78280.1 hypothetical protein XB05_05645 [Xanthomonas arboricola]